METTLKNNGLLLLGLLTATLTLWMSLSELPF